MIKLSLLGLGICFLFGTKFSLAQINQSNNEDSKITIEVLGQFENQSMSTTISAGSIAGLPGVNTDGLPLNQILPESENGTNIGLRGSYNIWNGVSVYGQLGYSYIGNGNLPNIQETINPILNSGVLPDIQFIDWSLLKVNARVTGGYSLLSSNFGVSYSHKINKIRITPFVGLGYYNLNTPGTALDASITVLILPVTADGLFTLEEQSQGELGFQAGLGITYDINRKFFIGLNSEYNKVDFDFGESAIKFNESALPSTLTSFIEGFDLSIIPDIPLDTKIDFSAVRFGMTIGMRL